MRSLSRYLVPLPVLLLGALLVGLPGGCGSASNVPTTVRGLVKFQGEPLAGGLIVFAPDADRGSRGAPVHAEVQADGSFQLQRDASANITPGWYRVAIAEPPTPTGTMPYYADFPSRLHRPDRSELQRQVQAGKENHFEFLIDANPTR